jgi:hypothetical protein
MAAAGRLFHLENTMNRTLLSRLERLEAARRPVEHKPVDDRAFMARITMMLAGGLAGLARRFG